MPFESLIPATFPTWDVDVGWPERSYANGAIGTAANQREQRYRRQNPGDGSNSQNYMIDIFAASLTPNWAIHKGLVCVTPFPQPTIRGSVFFFGDSTNIAGPFDSQGLVPSGALNAAVSIIPYERVYIDDFMVAFATSPPALLGPAGNIVVSFAPDASGTTTAVFGNTGSHYGLRPDGAGGIEWYSVIASVLQEVVPVAWPVSDFTQWVKVTVEHIMATPAGPGQVRLFLNDLPVLTRAWGVGTTLVNLAAGSARHMRRYFGQNVAEPEPEMYFTMFRSRIGRFTVDGTEIL